MKIQYMELLDSIIGDHKYARGPLMGQLVETKDGSLLQIIDNQVVATMAKGEWAYLETPDPRPFRQSEREE